MAFSTTKKLLQETQRQRLLAFLCACWQHVKHTSKKPVTSGYLRNQFGDMVYLSDMDQLRRIGATPLSNPFWETARISTADLDFYMSQLETL